MGLLENFLKDDDKRLFELNDLIYIKRVYSENGIIFECVKEPSITILTKKDDVRNWFEKL